MDDRSSSSSLTPVLIVVALVVLCVLAGGGALLVGRAAASRAQAVAAELEARTRAEVARQMELQARAEAEEAAALARQAQEQTGDSDARAQAVARFLTEVFTASDPAQPAPPMKELLAKAGEAAGKQFKEEPEVEAAVRLAIARSQQGAAEYAAAEANMLRSYELRAGRAAEARETARALSDLYAAWEKAEPGKGYEAKSAEWAAKAAGG